MKRAGNEMSGEQKQPPPPKGRRERCQAWLSGGDGIYQRAVVSALGQGSGERWRLRAMALALCHLLLATAPAVHCSADCGQQEAVWECQWTAPSSLCLALLCLHAD